MEYLSVAVALGLAVSLLFAELFGLAAGGMVVPGYLALAMENPLAVLLTLLAALLTFSLVEGLSSVALVYGRRRIVLTIIVGYLVGAIARYTLGDSTSVPTSSGLNTDLTVVGYVIPGLIAIGFDRQGIVATTTTLLIIAAVVRMLLILLLGSGVLS